MRALQLFIKRLFDFLSALLGTILVSPLFLLTVLGITLTMPGPIFFLQERVGKDGKCFSILKFRTMKVDKEAIEKHDFSKDKDRLTGFGKLLRRLKIDELPQLLNVLVGHMSLVGPRPTVREQVERYDDYQRRRLQMRPGMTGLAQVNGNISLSWSDRIIWDVRYVERFSLFLDLKIICKTVLIVFLGEARFKKAPQPEEGEEVVTHEEA